MSLPELVLARDPAARKVQTAGRLYFWAAFLPTFAATFEATAKYDFWPTWPKIVAATLGGLTSGVIALKAFRDGSYQKHADTINPPNTIAP